MSNLLVVQGGGGFVQNEQPGLGVEGLGNFQQLLLPGLQLRDHGTGVDVHSQVLKQVSGLPDHGLLVQHTKRIGKLLAEENVFING